MKKNILSYLITTVAVLGMMFPSTAVMVQAQNVNDEQVQNIENDVATESSEEMSNQDADEPNTEFDKTESDTNTESESELVAQDAVDKKNELSTSKKPWYYVSLADIVAQLGFVAIITLIGYFMYVRAKK